MNVPEQEQLHKRITTSLEERNDLLGFEVVVSEHAATVHFSGRAKPEAVYASLNFNEAIQRPKSCTLRVHKRKARS